MVIVESDDNQALDDKCCLKTRKLTRGWTCGECVRHQNDPPCLLGKLEPQVGKGSWFDHGQLVFKTRYSTENKLRLIVPAKVWA